MLYLIIASIAAIILGGLIFSYANENYFMLDWLFCIIGGAMTIVGGAGVIGVVILGVQWSGADVKAKMINREYGTNYTREEIFYASDSINIICELDRRRIEINGDFRRQRDPERNLPKPQPQQ